MNTKVLETLYLEIDWLQKVINHVISSYLQHESKEINWQEIPLPDLKNKEDCYAKTVTSWNLNVYERLTLVLAITPHFKPEVLDVFFGKNKLYDRGFTEFGGVVDKNHTGFLPTGETIMFVISATNKDLRYKVMDLFSQGSILIKEQVISLSRTKKHLPKYNGILKMSTEWLDYFLTGIKPEVAQSFVFPAKKINTKLEWKDLVLEESAIDELMEIRTWMKHENILLEDWNLNLNLKPGYHVFFHGPSGTGKTLTATLLGKTSNRDVYRVNLSILVSKYIGETEKHLAEIFDHAEQKDWILFFDEADALFGKRTSVRKAHDRFANQEVSYLLQRIENHPGIVILSSNQKNNIDEAFLRRFQSIIPFRMPSVKSRYKLWKQAFSNGCKLSNDVDLKELAEKHELSGGSINNVLRYVALRAIRRKSNTVEKKELMDGIRKEFKKNN